MTIKLEVGKTYLARDGAVETIVDTCTIETHPFLGIEGLLYAPNGRYLDDVTETKFDLIEEIKPEGETK